LAEDVQAQQRPAGEGRDGYYDDNELPADHPRMSSAGAFGALV
jgi:hypothetical protein